MFTPEGKYIREFTIDVPVDTSRGKIVYGAETPNAKTGSQAPGAPDALCMTPGPNPVLFVGDLYPSRIYKVSLEGKVLGVYGQPGLPLPEKKLGYVPLKFAQELLRMEGRATEIAIAVHRFGDAERIKPQLQAALGPDYEVSTWHEVASFVDEAIAAQNATLGVIAAIFLFIALLGIANTMLMSVLERTREIRSEERL